VGYDIRCSPEAAAHLAALSANERRKILDEVDEQLLYEPTVPTRKRKRLRPIHWQIGNCESVT
jgi:hypothetical protein